MVTDMTPEEIDALLSSQYYGHLGCSENDEPYVVPITYIYTDGNIVSYTHEGRKIEIMRKNPRVCVQVEQIKGAHHWQSAMCFGTCEEITDQTERQQAEIALADRFAEVHEENAGYPLFPVVEDMSARESKAKPIVYRIKIQRKTGRKENSPR